MSLNLKKNPLLIKSIPKHQINSVFNLLPPSYFNKHTLSQLSYFSLPESVYNKYFGHIPLYYIKELDYITFNLTSINLNYYHCERIYLINNDNVFILPNFTIKLI